MRDPAGELAQHRQQVRLRRPLGDLAQRRVDQGGSRTTEPSAADDRRPGPAACRPRRRRCPRAAGRAPPRRRPPARPARSAVSATARTRSSSSVSAFSVVCVTSAQTVAYGPGPRRPAPGRTRPWEGRLLGVDRRLGGTGTRVAVAAYPPTAASHPVSDARGGGRRSRTGARQPAERTTDARARRSAAARLRPPAGGLADLPDPHAGRRTTCRPCSPTSGRTPTGCRWWPRWRTG